MMLFNVLMFAVICLIVGTAVYRPAKLSADNHTVDRLSLYLTLKDDRDERVEAALVELLEGVKW